MAPDHVEHWMERNFEWLKYSKLSDLVFLPGSHDAGMSEISWNTDFGSEANCITQTLSIGDQLKCGARWFDIRPTYDDNKQNGPQWRCGHFSNTAVGWQGATGQSIQEVTNEVNNFVSNHKELVILRLTHVEKARTGGDVDSESQKDLVKTLLRDLTYVLKPTFNESDPKNQYSVIENMKLDELLKDHGCVILTTRNPDGTALSDDLWMGQKAVRTDYNPKPDYTSVTLGQTNAQASFSSQVPWVWKDSFGSILRLAAGYQELELRFMPQVLFHQKDCGPVQMDDIKDDRLLTVCLAASRAKHYALVKGKDYPSPVICVYGGQFITDPGVLSDIKRAMDAHTTFHVDNNSMKTDPWPTMRKSCCVFLMEVKNKNDDLFGKGRFAFENSELDFRIDIDKIRWGVPDNVRDESSMLTGRDYCMGYTNLFRAITKRETWRADPSQFNNKDPKAGEEKHLLVHYRSTSGQLVKERRVAEYHPCPFWIDIDSITYGGKVSPYIETYEPFFWRLERGWSLDVNNRTMRGTPSGDDWDPSPNNVKTATMRLVLNGDEHTYSCQENESWDMGSLLRSNNFQVPEFHNGMGLS